MKINKLNWIIVIGLVAIVGILVAQLLWTKEAFTIEEKKFGQKIHIALLEVTKKLYIGKNHDLPSENPVKKISNDYYIVNIENDFEPDILEFYLKSEFAKINITIDFEYAMYNCQSDEMVYGNYVSLTKKSNDKSSVFFPKHKNLIYYFAIRFPNQTSYLFSSLKFWFVLSFALIVILLVYVYSIFTILEQKKYSELQRDFINNMTHEFKTPLSSILIASNYLKNQNAIQSEEKLSKYTQIILDQSEKLNKHIDKILTVAKSDNAPLALNKQNIDLISVLESVIENIKLKYKLVEIKMLNNLKATEIYADLFHLNNLIYNLLDNSIKYCENNANISIHLYESNEVLKIDFVDNGIGISEKNLPLVFGKFYRIPNIKSNETNGFGLGLYYVKKICDLHGWKIAIKNNVNDGITISISIYKIN